MRRDVFLFIAFILLLFLLFFAVLTSGAVDIPVSEVFSVLSGTSTEDSYIKTIVLESRLPMIISSISCGATLSVAGLMMQTLFHNPLAGPSVLGISSGASFGVALFTLSAGGVAITMTGILQPLMAIIFAFAGGIFTIFILYTFSSVLKTSSSLLIVGLMISYLFSSGISLLNYFSPADEIRNYLIWGLGSFNGLQLSSSLLLLSLSIIFIIPTFIFIKPLNGLLLGESYLETVGYSTRKIRGAVLTITGMLVAVATAFCGPIGFLGLIVPHVCRLIWKSSNHNVLIPASIIAGAVISLACAFVSVLPSGSYGVLPINVITPVVGVPVILYLLVNRSKIPYFS